VKRLREKGKMAFDCPCGGMVSLVEPKEHVQFQSQVEAMDESANMQRDFNAFIMSAKGETSTSGFQEWAEVEGVTLAIAITDIVGLTKLGGELRDESINEFQQLYFAQSRKLIDRYNGREIKAIGNRLMVAFKSMDVAMDYVMALQKDTGHPQIKIRAGIHIGPMHVEKSDVFGDTVNFAARVIEVINSNEVWVSDPAKDNITRFGTQHKGLDWQRHDGVTLKGVSGEFTLWSLKSARNRVFISYSHKDKKLFGEFKTMLAPAIQKEIIELWDDTKIKTGTDWRDEIKAAIAAAKVGVLLVSPDFLASDFIAKNELPPLLKAAKDEGVTIFWACLSSCLYRETEIEKYQAAHDVGRPLDTLTKAKRTVAMKEICNRLLQGVLNQ